MDRNARRVAENHGFDGDWRLESLLTMGACLSFRSRGLDRAASFNISGFRAIKLTVVCWYLQSMKRLRPLHLPYDTIRYEMLF